MGVYSTVMLHKCYMYFYALNISLKNIFSIPSILKY